MKRKDFYDLRPNLNPPRPRIEMKKDHVPANLIAPIVRRYLREYQASTGGAPGQVIGNGDAWKKETLRGIGALGVFAEESGVNERWLRALLKGENKWIRHDQADKLLVCMGWVHLWWQMPLASWYWHTDISLPSAAAIRRRDRERERRRADPAKYAAAQREHRRKWKERKARREGAA